MIDNIRVVADELGGRAVRKGRAPGVRALPKGRARDARGAIEERRATPAMPTIREANLPDLGHKFQIETASGDRLTTARLSHSGMEYVKTCMRDEWNHGFSRASYPLA